MNRRTALSGMLLGGLIGFALSPAGCNGAPPPPPSGGTGAFGVVTINGKQKLYLPVTETTDGGNGEIAVVDVGVVGNGANGAPALVTNIDLGLVDQASTTAGDATVVLAAGGNTHKLWFINPTTDKITKTIDLDPSLNGSSFSGGGGVVTGIAMDEANHRAILSAWNGFLYVDLTSQTVTGSVRVAASENFGFDSTRELIIAPFYQCGGAVSSGNGLADAGPPCASYLTSDGGRITDGLNVVNLHTNRVYTYEDDSAANPLWPLGNEPDSAAVDSATGLAVIPAEGDGNENLLDLSKAVFNDDAGTFTAPHTVVDTVSDTGVAVEPTTHLAFFEEEHASHVSVLDLTRAQVDGGPPAGAEADGEIPGAPGGGGGWSNLGDPHGIAVTTGIQNGAAVGFVVFDSGDGPVWVARVDLRKMLPLGTGLDAGLMSTVVTMLDATTRE